MELTRDLRRNLPLFAIKSLIVGVFLLSVHSLVAFTESTETAVDRSFSADAEVNLFSLVDTLADPDEFSAFRESRDALRTLGSFYEALDAHPDLTYLSSFDQPVPVREFAGGDTFDEGYGMQSGARGTYLDPVSGRESRDVKSIQMNRDTFEFYRLHLSSGEEIAWDAVDYTTSRVPVLLGASYDGTYRVGDELDGNLYSKDLVLEVVGFLEPAASIFYKGETNFFLDDYVLIPYPPALGSIEPSDQQFAGILRFAMFNGDIAASKDMSADMLLQELFAISQQTGFSGYTLTDVPSYLVQLTLTRRLIQDNLGLVATIEVLLGAAAIGAALALNGYVALRRRDRDTVRLMLGHDRIALNKTLASAWVVETLMTTALLIVGVALLPVDSGRALMVTTAGLAVCAGLDLGHQTHLLQHHVIAPTQRTSDRRD